MGGIYLRIRKLAIAVLLPFLVFSVSSAAIHSAIQNVIQQVMSYELEVQTETNDYVYATDSLNYRSAPHTEAEIWGTVEAGTEIYRFGLCHNGWSKVLIDNIECYVCTDYVSTEKPVVRSYSYGEYSPSDLMTMGVIYWGGWRFTWYSERVLPGGGLNIPGRWSDGNFVRDCDGYLCVASSDLSKGTVLETPWGTAKVYDCGCASGTIDMYVSW